MSKNFTLHYVVNNFPDEGHQLIDIDDVMNSQYGEYNDVFVYLNLFKSTVRKKVVDNLLRVVKEIGGH